MTRTSGKERLLDAAEILFADKGYDGASMRAITRAAKVELGLANYHFGTKDELYRQVVLRRAPAMARDLEAALVDALKDESLEAIFLAFARIHFVHRYDNDDGWRAYIKLGANIALKGESRQLTRGAYAVYEPVFALYREAIARLRPRLSASEVECTFYVFHRTVLSLLINVGHSTDTHGEHAVSPEWGAQLETLIRTFAKGT